MWWHFYLTQANKSVSRKAHRFNLVRTGLIKRSICALREFPSKRAHTIRDRCVLCTRIKQLPKCKTHGYNLLESIVLPPHYCSSHRDTRCCRLNQPSSTLDDTACQNTIDPRRFIDVNEIEKKKKIHHHRQKLRFQLVNHFCKTKQKKKKKSTSYILNP